MARAAARQRRPLMPYVARDSEANSALPNGGRPGIKKIASSAINVRTVPTSPELLAVIHLAMTSQSPSITLRRARAADACTVAELFIASRRAAMPWLRDLHGLQATVAFFEAVVPARAEVWVAVEDGSVVGFIAFGRGEVEHLYVAPGRQGRGVGKRLLALAQQRFSSLELWVFAANHGARRFYERHGFRTVEETDGSRNEEHEPDVRYRWDR